MCCILICLGCSGVVWCCRFDCVVIWVLGYNVAYGGVFAYVLLCVWLMLCWWVGLLLVVVVWLCGGLDL